jgi:hypothetical protein
MNLKEIIHKTNRTEKEINYAFNILTQNNHTITRFLERNDINDMNKTLDNLYLISKSRIHKIRGCEFSFDMQYVLGLKDFPMPDIMHPSKGMDIIGKNLHWANEMFWNTIKPKQIYFSTNLYKTIYNHYIKVIPECDLKLPFIQKMIHVFVQFETNRITSIFNELGKSNNVIQEYIYPLFHELAIENHSNYLMGLIDRIDRATNDKLIFIDYKYGKPKYYYKKPADKTYINLELGFYAILPQGKDVYVTIEHNGKNVLYPLKEILPNPTPYYGCMLFFQDVEETMYLLPITQRIINQTKKVINKYWDTLEEGKFVEKPQNYCYEWCPYYKDFCQFNYKWLEIEHALNPMKLKDIYKNLKNNNEKVKATN